MGLERKHACTGLRGRLDTVFYKTENAQLGAVLRDLGGVVGTGANVPVLPQLPTDFKIVNISGADKKPVHLTSANFDKVHEPKSHATAVPCDLGDILLDKLPPEDKHWGGYWGGTEESRILYLRKHHRLWGWVREKDVVRRTGVFFIPKKAGDERLRKILACIDANNATIKPKQTRLPGPWNLIKIRFRNSRFLVGEADVEAFYSALLGPKWLMYLLCLLPVLADDVFDFSESEVYVCSYSGESFRRGEWTTPAWPRMPMGFDHAVDAATSLAIQLLSEVAPAGSVCLNVRKEAWLATASAKLYWGAYIDNIFTIGQDGALVNKTQAAFSKRLEDAGLVLSENNEAAPQRKLLGVNADGESEDSGLKAPAGLSDELYTISQMKRCEFQQFERMIGKVSWIAILCRLFFSLIFHGFRLQTRLRQRNTPRSRMIRLSAKVRAEFYRFAVLLPWLVARLQLNPAPSIFAADASLQGWAIVEQSIGGAFILDTGLTTTELEQRLLCRGKWRVVKQRRFRRRLENILPGEITAFRQSATSAAHKFCVTRDERVGVVDVICYSDNSPVYFTVRKGRSSTFSLNELCVHLLLLELVHRVRAHGRWCGTKFMPADFLTRSTGGADSHSDSGVAGLCTTGADSSEPETRDG